MSPDFQMTVSAVEANVPVTVIEVAGEIGGHNAQTFQSQASEAIAAGSKNTVLDLSGVSYMSSAGLRVVHILYKELQPEDADSPMSPYLKLLSPPGNIRRAMKALGFDRFLEVYDTQDEAVASF